MDKQEFTNGLRGLAKELEPFIDDVRPGQRVWNGSAWEPTNETKHGDKYAAIWRSNLNTIADLLDLQDSPISAAQRDYLDRTIFGTAGSFHDFRVDTKTQGKAAAIANENLDLLLAKLYEVFKG